MPSTVYATFPIAPHVPLTNQTCVLLPEPAPTLPVAPAVNNAAATYQPPVLYPDVTNAMPTHVVTPSSGTNNTPVYHMSVTMCMEVVWHGEFDKWFQLFPDLWRLAPTSSLPVGSHYQVFQDSAKVRFACQNCGRAWTSMKGRVSFWFCLNRDAHEGEVLFKLYGQQCQRCPDADFSHAMWYPEEVIKVIENLFNRVGTAYYGFVLPPIRVDRRTGKPRAQHDSSLCQACKDGVCKEVWALH